MNEMFSMTMPITFKVGDTADVKINFEPKQLTWQDEDTLVIEPDDARKILYRTTDGELIHFVCSDAAEED
jgi:hypothetical protein